MKSIQQVVLRGSAVIVVAAATVAVLAGCSGGGPETAPPQGNGPPSSAQATPVAQQATVTPFQGVIPATPDNHQCSLDEINGQPAGSSDEVARGSTVIFGGWAGNGQGQAAKQFVLVLKGAQGSFSAPLTTGVERPDVAKAWNTEGMAKSGYNIAASLAGVAAGAYSLYVADPANSTAACDLHRRLIVR